MKEGETVGVGEGNDGHESVSSRRIIPGYLKYWTNQQSQPKLLFQKNHKETSLNKESHPLRKVQFF